MVKYAWKPSVLGSVGSGSVQEMTNEYKRQAELPLSVEGWAEGKLGPDRIDALGVGMVNNFHLMRVYPSFYKDSVVTVQQGMDRDAPYVNWDGMNWKNTVVADLPSVEGPDKRSSIPNKLLVELYMKDLVRDETTEGGAYYRYKVMSGQREMVTRIIPAFERRLSELLEEHGLVNKDGKEDALAAVRRTQKIPGEGKKAPATPLKTQ